jgi:hypothetical protein
MLKLKNSIYIIQLIKILAIVDVAHLGFTTSVWWSPCCSSWFHHQCLVGSVLLILVSPPVFGEVRVAHLGEERQNLSKNEKIYCHLRYGYFANVVIHLYKRNIVQHRYSNCCKCVVGSVLLILVSPPVFGQVCVAHLGFTTNVWWGPCCSSWFHHQCLVRSVLLILVSPPMFGGVRRNIVQHRYSNCCNMLLHQK